MRQCDGSTQESQVGKRTCVRGVPSISRARGAGWIQPSPSRMSSMAVRIEVADFSGGRWLKRSACDLDGRALARHVWVDLDSTGRVVSCQLDDEAHVDRLLASVFQSM